MLDETTLHLRISRGWLLLSAMLNALARSVLRLSGVGVKLAEGIITLQRRVDGRVDEALGMTRAAIECLESDGR